MSQGQTLYLAMVLVAFFCFIGVVLFLSIWSRKPGAQAASGSASGHASVSAAQPVAGVAKRAA